MSIFLTFIRNSWLGNQFIVIVRKKIHVKFVFRTWSLVERTFIQFGRGIQSEYETSNWTSRLFSSFPIRINRCSNDCRGYETVDEIHRPIRKGPRWKVTFPFCMWKVLLRWTMKVAGKSRDMKKLIPYVCIMWLFFLMLLLNVFVCWHWNMNRITLMLTERSQQSFSEWILAENYYLHSPRDSQSDEFCQLNI